MRDSRPRFTGVGCGGLWLCQASGACGRKAVEVRALSSAPPIYFGTEFRIRRVLANGWLTAAKSAATMPHPRRASPYDTTVIAIVPAVRFPVPVDVTDGVAVTVAVPGAMPRTSPASETVKTLVLDESKMT